MCICVSDVLYRQAPRALTVGPRTHFVSKMLEPQSSLFLHESALCEEKSHGVGPCPSPIAGAWRRPCVPPQRAAGSREIAVVLLDRAGSEDDLSSTAMGRAVWLPLACCSRRSAAVLEWMEGRWLSLRGGSKRSRRSACIMSPASTCVTGLRARACVMLPYVTGMRV